MVEVQRGKYYVEDDKLDLSGLIFSDISKIKGLERLTNLKYLDLTYNEIKETNGLEHLTLSANLHLLLPVFSHFSIAYSSIDKPAKATCLKFPSRALDPDLDRTLLDHPTRCGQYIMGSFDSQ